jgi:prophage regulatory protein
MNSYGNSKPARLIRLDEVKQRTGLTRSTLYAKIRSGLFPKPISLTSRCVAWLDSEVDAWIAERVNARLSK